MRPASVKDLWLKASERVGRSSTAVFGDFHGIQETVGSMSGYLVLCIGADGQWLWRLLPLKAEKGQDWKALLVPQGQINLLTFLPLNLAQCPCTGISVPVPPGLMSCWVGAAQEKHLLPPLGCLGKWVDTVILAEGLAFASLGEVDAKRIYPWGREHIGI